MDALRTNFEASLVAALGVVVVVGLAAVAAHRQASSSDAVHRVLLAGAAVLIVAATALPGSWPPHRDSWGDLVLGLGEGGLADWRLLADPFGTLAAVELWANVAVYVPLGVAAWLLGRSVLRAIAVGSGLSVAIEAWQWAALSRVAATDDVLLNVTGTALGAAVAAGVTSVVAARPR